MNYPTAKAIELPGIASPVSCFNDIAHGKSLVLAIKSHSGFYMRRNTTTNPAGLTYLRRRLHMGQGPYEGLGGPRPTMTPKGSLLIYSETRNQCQHFCKKYVCKDPPGNGLTSRPLKEPGFTPNWMRKFKINFLHVFLSIA